MMNGETFDNLLDRYRSGEATPDEVRELEKFLRADGAARRMLVERFLLEVHLHRAFAGNLPTRRPASRFRKNYLRAACWAAAAIVLLATGILLWSLFQGAPGSTPEVVSGQVLVNGAAATKIPNGVPFEVPGGKTTEIVLPDNSRVELEPFSKASFPEPTADAGRLVELIQGGGAFQVTHGGGKFLVKTPAGTVTVLGTKFSVKLQGQVKSKSKTAAKGGPVLAVSVTEGTVRVDAGGQSHILTAGKSQVFGANGEQGEQNNQDDGQQNNKNNGNQGNNQNGNDGEK